MQRIWQEVSVCGIPSTSWNGNSDSHVCKNVHPAYQKLRVHTHGECRERFPRHRLQRKPHVSDPGKHHGTCVTHVPWCMSGALTRGDKQDFPGLSGVSGKRPMVGNCVVVVAEKIFKLDHLEEVKFVTNLGDKTKNGYGIYQLAR